jgi:tetratricopeptide (TPR) repeat protein
MIIVLKKYFLLPVVLFGLIPVTVKGQKNNPTSFPSEYYSARTDTARMRFLMNAINDSLNSGQLRFVYVLAQEGLQLAEKNNVDSMKGIFYFDVAKAFAYYLHKPDSAIVYFKKVLPYFPDKLRFYNLVSVREIMERFVALEKKDSVFAYLDSLHERIDTLSLTNPRRYGISAIMASAYQYYGMFRTAITLYENSIEGLRKAGYSQGIGLPMANLAELYDESGDIINAVSYAREALGYLDRNNMPFMGTAANLASYYIDLNRIDSALYFNRLADSVARVTHDVMQEKVRDQFNYVDILCAEKKFTEAKKILSLIQPWLNQPGNEFFVKYLICSGSIDSGLHNWTDASDTLLKALSIVRKNGPEISTVLVLKELAAVYAKRRNFGKAYQYQQEYIQRKDSLSGEETKSRLSDFDAMYKTGQKEQHIALLQKDNDIKNLQLKNSRQWNIFYLGGFIFLLVGTAIYFYQRNSRLKIQAQKTKAELQMQLFRSQMNPHFIFNSLNGIEYFILQNEKRNASLYLNKFASLIRIILSNSRKDLVPFADDMHTIRLYVDLELLRFNQSFCYLTDIDQQLLDSDYQVPPLLIQPFVENAIIHGFGSSDRKGLQLKISATLQSEYIVYGIEDNGVGRQHASVYNALNKPDHTSLGLQITQQRIAIFNEQHQANSTVNIEDLLDQNKQTCGTRVTVKIKTV